MSAEPRIVIRWWVVKSRALALYAVVSAALLAVLALRTSGQFMSVHRLLMGAGAVALLYFVAVHALNATELRLHDDTLIVRHGPLPWRGGMRIPLSEVDALAVDGAAHRLQLRTVHGEEVAIVEDLLPSVSTRLEKDVARIWRRDAAS